MPGSPKRPRRINPNPTAGWGAFQKKQAIPVMVNFNRYRSIRQAELHEHIDHDYIKRRIAAGVPGYFNLYGCACTTESLKIHGRCTCHDEQ